jgi:hypothetical protein
VYPPKEGVLWAATWGCAMAHERFDTIRRRSTRLFSFVDYLHRRSNASEDIFPTDEASGFVPGPDPDQIVVIGEATALGFGVLSHRMGVAAQFASQLAAHSGRGVRWTTLGLPGYRIRSAARVIASERELWASTDFVIVIAGIADTLRLTTVRSWSHHVRSTIHTLVRVLPVDAQILMAEIPPLSDDGGMSPLTRLASGRQARKLNQATRTVVATCPRCRLVRFPDDVQQELWHPEARPAKYAELYQSWARSMLEDAARGSRERLGHGVRG